LFTFELPLDLAEHQHTAKFVVTKTTHCLPLKLHLELLNITTRQKLLRQKLSDVYLFELLLELSKHHHNTKDVDIISPVVYY
jgi:hypothetical protein